MNTLFIIALTSLQFASLFSLTTNAPYFTNSEHPLILAHRGASGYIPEHTLQSYATGFYMNADFVEPDFVPTKDGRLVCVHNPGLKTTTNVADFQQFADRFEQRNFWGEIVDDWFIDSFTLDELKMLKVKQRIAGRDEIFNWFFTIPTAEEMIELVISLNQNLIEQKGPSAKLVGIYPELKYPMWYLEFKNFNTMDMLYSILQNYQIETWEKANNILPVIIQAFNKSALEYFTTKTNLPLIYLQSEVDFTFAQIAQFAHGTGPSLQMIVASINPFTLTNYITQAHAAGLKVHPYTVRDDILQFGATPCQQYRRIKQMNADGLFTEFPDNAYDYFMSGPECYADNTTDSKYSAPPQYLNIFDQTTTMKDTLKKIKEWQEQGKINQGFLSESSQA